MDVKMNGHIGNSLGYIVSTYPTLISVILELVQNSLDSGSKEVSVIVDYSKRTVRVRDDGSGISVSKFTEAIQSVCSSMKDKSKLGQFGIGLLSPLGKCKDFWVTSIAKGQNAVYNRWFFDSKKILNSFEWPVIPHSELRNTIYSRTGGASKNYEVYNFRTEVSIQDFRNDRTMTDMSAIDLQRMINSRFSEAMRILDVEIHIVIKFADGKKENLSFKAAKFTGEKMKPVIYGNEKTGQTYFEMYIAPKTASGRKGEVSVGIKDDLFRISVKDFSKTIIDYASAETISVLNSGNFEGFIVSDACTLHQNRKEFEGDDYLVNMVIHLDEWVKNHAQPLLVSMKDSKRDEWLQAVGSLAISSLEGRLKNMPHLLNVIKGFKMGLVKTRLKENGQDYKSKIPSSPISYIKGKGQTAAPGTGSSEVTKLTVAGPNGQRRRLVSGSATGLQFVYEELPGNDHHWEFDSTNGILVFNMRSDIWEKVERSGDRNMVMYQEYIGMKALEMQLVPDVSRPAVFDFLQKELMSAISLLVGTTNAKQAYKARSKFGQKI